jgi:hypothetical protein
MNILLSMRCFCSLLYIVMDTTTLSKIYSAKSFNLVSKKQYLFNDDFMKYVKHLTVPMFAFNGYCILDNMKPLDIVTHLMPSLFLTDILTVFWHLYSDLYDSSFIVEDGYLVVKSFTGYIFAHHVFTSCYNDVGDDILISHKLVLTILPVILALVNKRKNIAKYCAYVSVFFPMLVLSHKYAHMKRHNIKIPFLYEILQKFNLSLDPEKHSAHHYTHTENYSTFNGWCDPLINKLLQIVKLNRIDSLTSNIFRYAKEQKTNKIKLRFKGDINGDIVMYLKDGQMYSKSDYKILHL